MRRVGSASSLLSNNHHYQQQQRDNNDINGNGKGGRPYFLNRSSTVDWTAANKGKYQAMLVPLTLSNEHHIGQANSHNNDYHKPTTTSTSASVPHEGTNKTSANTANVKINVKKHALLNRVEMEYTHIPSHSQIKYKNSPNRYVCMYVCMYECIANNMSSSKIYVYVFVYVMVCI